MAHPLTAGFCWRSRAGPPEPGAVGAVHLHRRHAPAPVAGSGPGRHRPRRPRRLPQGLAPDRAPRRARRRLLRRRLRRALPAPRPAGLPAVAARPRHRPPVPRGALRPGTPPTPSGRRIDWKYLLGLPLDDPGFDFSVLSEFRARLVEHGAEHVLLDKVVDACRERGLLKTRGRQRTDSTHVVAAVRELNRLELAAETVRAALNELAGAAPDWLRRLARPEWYDRYGRRVEDSLLPQSKAGRARHAVAVGTDGYALLDAVEADGAPPGLAALPVVDALRRIWGRHYERDAGGVRLRELRGRGPEKGDSVESPVRRRRPVPAEARDDVDGLHGPSDRDVRRRRARGSSSTPTRRPATSTRPRGPTRSSRALDERGLSASEHLADAAYISGRPPGRAPRTATGSGSSGRPGRT